MEKAFVSNNDESIKLFENGVLDALTKVHPVAPPVVFLPVIGFLLFSAAKTFHVPWWESSVLFLGGLLFWTLFEYAMHRFLFHAEPKNAAFKRLHFLFHGIHHAYPRDSRRLVMPPSVSIPLSLLIYWGVGKLIPGYFLQSTFAGFMFGYLAYDMMHYAIHHLAFNFKWWQTIRKHHLQHHYGSSNRLYGVSSPLWDHIFRTH